MWLTSKLKSHSLDYDLIGQIITILIGQITIVELILSFVKYLFFVTILSLDKKGVSPFRNLNSIDNEA